MPARDWPASSIRDEVVIPSMELGPGQSMGRTTGDVAHRALVTILEEGPAQQPNETALLSEAVLGKDWNRPEEDAAWSHLQSVQ